MLNYCYKIINQRGVSSMVKDMIEEIEKELLEIASKGYDSIAEEEEEAIDEDIDDGDLIGHAFTRGCKMAR